MVSNMNKVQSIIGYTFKNNKLLWEALQAPGAVFKPGELKGPRVSKSPKSGWYEIRGGNRNLALLGDSVLKAVLYEIGYQTRLTPGKNL